MDDLISRQAAVDAVKHAWHKGLYPVEYIEELPTVQPERKKGKWVEDEDGLVCCSRCWNPCEINGITGEFMYSPYCSECGADMRGEDDACFD